MKAPDKTFCFGDIEAACWKDHPDPRAASLLWAAEQLSCEPGTLSFGHEPSGRPILLGAKKSETSRWRSMQAYTTELSLRVPRSNPEAEQLQKNISISLSHSASWFALVLSKSVSVGIDIEAIRTDLPILDIAALQFCPEEVKLLKQEKSPKSQNQLFFRLWTCKEAILKAMGQGIAGGMSTPNLANFCSAADRLDFVRSHIASFDHPLPSPPPSRGRGVEIHSHFLQNDALTLSVAWVA